MRSTSRSEEHTSELQSLAYLVCRLLLEKKKNYRSGITMAESKKQHSLSCLSALTPSAPAISTSSSGCGRRLRLRFFFFNDTATTEIYTLFLHDALPIFTVTCVLSHRDGHQEETPLTCKVDPSG